MNKLYILAILILLIVKVGAFDPAGPPPKKTMEWTCSSLSTVRIPIIDFEDVTVEEAVHFFHIPYPENYRVEINCSRAGKLAKRKISFKAKNLTFIEAIGRVANEAGLNILITPGTVYLIPKKSGEQGASLDS